jgi:hypothetical protein
MRNARRTSCRSRTRQSIRTLFWTTSLLQRSISFSNSAHINSQVKCSEIVVSVNVTKVMYGVITSLIIALRDLLPMVGFDVGMATSDDAGWNWVSYRDTLSMHSFCEALPCEILEMY